MISESTRSTCFKYAACTRYASYVVSVADGQRSGMTPESLKNAAAASKHMQLEEAYKILGTDSKAGIDEVMKVG